MKLHFAALCAFGCLGVVSFLGVSRAQQPAPEQTVYVLKSHIIVDTSPSESVWTIQKLGMRTDTSYGEPAYKSLDSSALHKWVSELPQGTEIQYRLSSLPKIGNSLRDPERELPAFKQFCKSKGVNFNNGFPIL